MSEANQSGSAPQPNKNNAAKAKAAPVLERAEVELGSVQRPADPIGGTRAAGGDDPIQTALLYGPAGVFGGGSVDQQVARLNDSCLATVQRQALATRIGQAQGNRHLEQAIAALNQIQREGNAPEAETEPNDATSGPLENISPNGITIALYDVTESHHHPKSCPICRRYVHEKLAEIADTHLSSGPPMSVDADLLTNNLYKEAEAWHIRKSHEDSRRFALGDMSFFRTEAERFASDYHALALSGEDDVVEGAMPVASVEELANKIQAVSMRVETLLTRMGNLQAPRASLVKTVALFGHGGNRWMGIGGDLRPRQARQLVQNIQERLTSDVIVVLYACSTAAGGNEGENTLADVIHDALVQEAGNENASVWGHMGAGSATGYPFWREFSGSDPVGGGRAFFDEAFPRQFIDTEAEQLNLTQPTQRRNLINAMRRVYTGGMRGDQARNLPFQTSEARQSIIMSLQERWRSSRQRDRLNRSSR